MQPCNYITTSVAMLIRIAAVELLSNRVQIKQTLVHVQWVHELN